MKLSKVKNLPIISLSRGNINEKVETLLVNSQKATIDFIVVSSSQADQAFEKRLFKFSDVIGLGDYALTIDDPSSIKTIASQEIFNQLFDNTIELMNLNVISKLGNHIGVISDFFFDSNTGKIKCIFVQGEEENLILECDQHFIITKDIVISDLKNAMTQEAFNKMEAQSKIKPAEPLENGVLQVPQEEPLPQQAEPETTKKAEETLPIPDQRYMSESEKRRLRQEEAMRNKDKKKKWGLFG